MANEVKFIQCTQEKYDALAPKEAGTLYFCTDTHRVYKGDVVVGNSASISKDGTETLSIPQQLNFVGQGFNVSKNDQGGVDISMPFNLAKMNASQFNSAGGNTTAPAKDTTSSVERYVAKPSNGEYYVGDWNGSSGSKSVLNNQTATAQCNSGFFWFANTSSTFKLEILQGGSVIKTVMSDAITNNGTYAKEGFSVTITEWTEDFMGYKAKASFSMNMETLLAAGGRFKYRLSHINGGATNKFESQEFIYDNSKSSGSIGSVTIAEDALLTKYKSGIEYATTGSSYTISAKNLTGFFGITFNSNVLSYNCTSLNKSGNVAASIVKSLPEITNNMTVNNYTATINPDKDKYIPMTSQDVKVTFTPTDGFTDGTSITSTGCVLSKSIDTYTEDSTNSFENFTGEKYRLKPVGNGSFTKWNSQEALTAGNLQVGEGTKLLRNANDGGDQVYYRNYKSVDQSCANGKFTLAGSGLSEDNLKNGNFKLEISLDGTDWFTLAKDQNPNEPMINGSGCRVKAATEKLSGNSGKLAWAFPAGMFTDVGTGKGGQINSFGLYVKITIKNGMDQSIKFDSVNLEMA